MRTEKGALESISESGLETGAETNSRRHPGVGATSPCLPSLQKDTTLDPFFREERERETQWTWFPASITGFCSFRTKGKEGECFELSLYVTKVAPIDMWMLVLWERYSECCFVFFETNQQKYNILCTAVPSTPRNQEWGSSKCHRLCFPGPQRERFLQASHCVLCQKEHLRTDSFPQVCNTMVTFHP